MIFNDFSFLLLFLPATIAGFLVAPSRWREILLLGASLLFYGIAGIEHVLVLLGCVAWVWAFTVSDAIRGSRLRLAAAIAGPLLALFYYKYLGFVVRDILGLASSAGGMAAFADKLLPAGISFFTFHLAAFAIDRYQGKIEHQPSWSHYALYIAFFPHLVAGPILRYHEVSQAIDQLPAFRPAETDWSLAIGYFCFGLAAKVLLADGLSTQVQPLSAAPAALSPVQAGYLAVAYSFQIYFDFWGYSLMATGLAFLFGFRFPKNFDRPYEALNPQDFWRRWHMTLGRWFRDYLYIPLGGNRQALRNVLIVFAICGLWHGAAWQFVIWGMYHGALVVLYHLVRPWWDRLPIFLQRLLTFTLVSLGWILFLFDFPKAITYFASLLGQGQASGGNVGVEAWGMLAMGALACFLFDPEKAVRRSTGGALAYARTAALAGLFTLAVLFIDRSNSFIYFRF
jgi:alginate O-acetyltransferase complex protein AlgI